MYKYNARAAKYIIGTALALNICAHIIMIERIMLPWLLVKHNEKSDYIPVARVKEEQR